MNKISKEKKQQIVLVFIGASIVIAILWMLVIKMQSEKLAGIQKKTIEMQEKVGKAESLLKKSAEIEATLDTETKALEDIEETMASGDIYLWLINMFNHFNDEKKIAVADFPREISGDVGLLPKFPYKAVVFPIKGTGFYHDIGRFLAKFENSFPYMRIQNLELAPAGKSDRDDAEKLTVKFEIVALVKPNDK